MASKIEHIDHMNRNYRTTEDIKCCCCEKEIGNHSEIYVIERARRIKDVVFCSKKCIAETTIGHILPEGQQLTIWYCMLQKEEKKNDIAAGDG